MKVSREQVAENRRRILDAAAQLFRQRGFDTVTVAEVMHAAGLTHGGFYGHFDSKEALIAAAMAHEQTAKRSPPPAESPSRYADGYLHRQHRDNIGVSCPFSALGTDAARASPAVRHTLTESLRAQIDAFHRGFRRSDTSRATPQCDSHAVRHGGRHGAGASGR